MREVSGKTDILGIIGNPIEDTTEPTTDPSDNPYSVSFDP